MGTVSAPPFCAYEGEPEATIWPGDRFGYWVNVHWGLMTISTAPWWRPSRASAERKALREIRWWKAREQPRKSWRVTL